MDPLSPKAYIQKKKKKRSNISFVVSCLIPYSFFKISYYHVLLDNPVNGSFAFDLLFFSLSCWGNCPAKECTKGSCSLPMHHIHYPISIIAVAFSCPSWLHAKASKQKAVYAV
jgi:hypothetical protein